MPAYDQQQKVATPMSDFLRQIPQQGDHALLSEISALRKEIAALRSDLLPPKSVLIIGNEVSRLYELLNKATQ